MSAHRAGRLDEALELYRRALDLDPTLAVVHANVGAIHLTRNRPQLAEEALAAGLARAPGNALILNNLGLALMHLGRLEAAANCFETLLVAQPGNAQAMQNLGLVRLRQGKVLEALQEFEDAAAIDPRQVEAWINLGNTLRRIGRLTRAHSAYRQALDVDQTRVDTWADLGNVLALSGQHEAAGQALLAPVDWTRATAGAVSERLFSLNYLPDLPPEETARLHRSFAAFWPAQPRPALPVLGSRPLRIGYVSGDFRFHPVGRFFLPLLAAHDRSRVRAICYSAVERPDAVTEIIRGRADGWCAAVGLDDDALAERIRADGIDVLVDLSGHTADNRLGAFARRPAPVQVSWLGYPNTTGLPAIDYRVTDDDADPLGAADARHTERLVRLPGGFLCYVPPGDAPAVGPTPALAAGFVTFGSFNNFAKMNQRVLTLWARIVTAVPGARLVLKSEAFGDAPTLRRAKAFLAAAGLARDALTIKPFETDYKDHLEAYRQIDIALDTFPYNGTTTTCEALAMGVPVVTLAGHCHAGRVGVSLLRRVGLERLIANSEAMYHDIALGLTRDVQALDAFRSGSRQRLIQSPLGNPARLAREMEEAFLVMVDGTMPRYQSNHGELADLKRC